MFRSILHAKPRVFRLLLASYLLFLVVPLLAGILLYRGAATALQEEAIRVRLGELDRGRDAVDRELRALDTSLIELAQRPAIHALLPVPSALQGAGICRVIDAWQELARVRLSAGFVRDVFLTFERSGVVLTPAVAYVRRECFDRGFFSCGDRSYDEWCEDFLHDAAEKRWLPATSISFSGSSERVVTLVRPLPLGSGADRQGFATAFVRESALEALLAGAGGGGQPLVLAGDGTMIAGSPLLTPALARARAERVGDWWLLATPSLYGDWTFVLAVPDGEVMAGLYAVRGTLLAVLAVLSLAGIVTATVLADRQTRPIRELVGVLGRNLQESGSSSANELEQVRETVFALLAGNRDLAKALRRQTPLVRHSFLSRLVKGELADRHEIELLGAEAGVDLRGPRYLVLVAVFPMRGRMTQAGLAGLNVARTAFVAGLGRALPPRSYVVETEVDEIAVIVSADRDETAPESARAVAAAASDMHARDGRDACPSVSAAPVAPGMPFMAAGTVADDVMAVFVSYTNARLAARYAAQEGRSGRELVWFDEIPRDSRSCYYPLGLENRIVALAHQGDCEAIDDLLALVRQENFERRRLGPAEVGELYAELVATVAKAAGGANGDGSAAREVVIGLRSARDGQLLGPSAEEFFSLVGSAFRELCRGVENRHRAHSRRLRDEVLEHIRASYADPNLCLQSIATRFRLSPFYVSQFFKEQTGENFHQYLERMRLDAACELLRATDLPVADVASRCGYCNLSTFRKAFRRVLGSSPRDVRQRASAGAAAAASGRGC